MEAETLEMIWGGYARQQAEISRRLMRKKKTMHYKNGREAKNGDKVLLLSNYGAPVVGILYDAVAGNDTCNGRLAPCSPTDPCPNLAECLHVDDVKALTTVPDSTKT